MIVSIWKNLQHLSAGKKSTSSFMFSLRYCKDIVNWLFFGTLGLSGYLHPKWYYHLVEYFCVYLQAKTQFHPPSFYGDIAKIWKLILVLWACTVTRIQNDSIILLKTSMFICMQKINFIILFFLTILHFKESCSLIGRQHFGP